MKIKTALLIGTFIILIISVIDMNINLLLLEGIFILVFFMIYIILHIIEKLKRE